MAYMKNLKLKDNKGASNANDAIHIQQVIPDAGSHKSINTFNPTYTHTIFGDEESIFGFKGLRINLLYNATDMRPCVSVEFKKKYKTVGDVEPTDINAALEPYLPPSKQAYFRPRSLANCEADAFDKIADFDKHIATSTNFKPTGELIKTISAEGGAGDIQIFRANASHPAVKQLLGRLQILNLFYIDGGQPLHEDEYYSGRWTVYTMYDHSDGADGTGGAYKFLGYSTVYAYHPIVPSVTPAHPTEKIDIPYPYPAEFVSDLPVRSRISQFVILPPYQHSGLGAALYSSVYQSLLADPLVFEVTVEDPSEAFDDLRDLNDLAFLRAQPEFQALKINSSVKVAKKARIPTKQIIKGGDVEELRRKFKIAPRQFQRVLEMHLLATIPTSVRRKVVTALKTVTSQEQETQEYRQGKAAYRLWGLVTKQRLYKHNRDSLQQLPRTERVDKLEETMYGVEMDYLRLLRKLERGPGKHPEEDATRGREDEAGDEEEEEGSGEEDEDEKEQAPVKVNVLQGKKRGAGDDVLSPEAKKAKN